MPLDLKACTGDIEEQTKQIHENLELLETGRMTIGEREGNGPWRDDPTPETIKPPKSSPPAQQARVSVTGVR